MKKGFIGAFYMALLMIVFAFATVPICLAQATNDSKEVSDLLSKAKTEAIQLEADAEHMASFAHSKLSWHSHAAKIEEIKQHVNTTGELLAKMANEKVAASPWQQEAIDRITPLLKELASSVTSTIKHLNEKPELIRTNPYTDYVKANYELAVNLSNLISDYVEYGQVKSRSEELGTKLEVSGS
jgi:HD-GYP domain-containing protein (c-di-GMP phosphodiesterase class II)